MKQPSPTQTRGSREGHLNHTGCDCLKKKRILIPLAILIVYVTIALLPKPMVNEDNPFLREDTDMPFLIAHGGGNREFPDNTLEAFYNAYFVDPDVMMETDVSITNDDVVILSHDLTLDRKTSLKNAVISEIDYADLMADEINFGYQNSVEDGINTSGDLVRYENYLGETVTPLDVTYPEGIEARHESKFLATTLEELITAFPDNYINVEIKQTGDIGLEALNAVIELMEDLDDEYDTFSRIVLASFHDAIYEALLDIKENDHPELMLSPGMNGAALFYGLQLMRLNLFYAKPVTVLQIPTDYSIFNLTTSHLIEQAHNHGIAVHYWTIDDEDTMERLIELGVDGIMTNYPSKLKTVYDTYE